ncbi:MAG: CoA pyrophosphatase [Anaerolineae bacterium]
MKRPHALTLEDVTRALQLPDFDVQAAWQPMRMRPNLRRDNPPPGQPVREAGVLVLIYPGTRGLSTLLIQRTPDPGIHSGQIGFPGGSRETDDRDLQATALREACEEVGVCRDDVRVLGQLTRVYIPPSQFLVWPVVGALQARPTFRPSPAEVAGLIELPLADLLQDGLKRETDMQFGAFTVRVPYYSVEGHIVWGATALMLAELEARLRAVTPLSPGR